jgi:hypothetical protein
MPEEGFVKYFHELKTDLLKSYFNPSKNGLGDSPVASEIHSPDVARKVEL